METTEPSGRDDVASDAAIGVLARARLAVDGPLYAAVGALPPSMRRVAGYHFGWLTADGTPADEATARRNRGKALRPALVLAATRALGGDPADAVAGATAVELVHNFTLLHDDVMDRDLFRHHQPTAWSVFGVTDAILVGDALHALAMRVLAEDTHPAAMPAARRLAACVAELCDGQHADCAFERRDDVSLAECLTMAEAKTGALLGCACAVGALYAGADTAAADALDSFGRQAGLAFQLIDDILGIWGDPAVTGKPAGADLAARKKSLPVVAALNADTAAAAELTGLYRAGRPLTAREVGLAADRVAVAGGRAWAQVEAADRMGEAIEHLTRAVPDRTAAADLLALTELLTRRPR